jgi:uncharacterized protein
MSTSARQPPIPDEPTIKRLNEVDHVSPEILAFLLAPRSYSHEVDRIDMIESRMSLVFLAGDLAFKMKKPIAFNSVDHRQIANRHENCLRETTLNQALSPDIYLGVLPVTRAERGDLEMDGTGKAVEWLVVMRRLEERRLLDHAIADDAVKSQDIDVLLETLCRFYAKPLASNISSDTIMAGWQDMFARNSASLRRPEFGLPRDQLDDVLNPLARFLDINAELIVARVKEGWIRECHGDLRPQHVYLGPPLRLIDRLEYDEKLRLRDPFEEVLDLGLECERLGAGWILPKLLDGLQSCLRVQVDPRLIAFYAGMRATLRARLAIDHVGGARGTTEKWRGRALACIKLAKKHGCFQE